jgi:CelD/BcsL family acetyltransferase involved in cellulose biosynthesis
MDCKLFDYQSLDKPAWERLSRNGSFFQTHHWMKICIQGITTGVDSIFLCGFENGALVAGIPAIISKRYGFRSFYAMPYGTYGDVLFEPDLPKEKRGDFYRFLVDYLESHRFSRISITNFNGALNGLTSPLLKKERYFTHIISLNGHEEHNPPDKKVNGHIRSGQRAETEIIRLTRHEQIDDFYALYKMTEQRHGSRKPLYSRRFFRAILENLRDSDTLYWTCLISEGAMIGSCINFIYNGSLFNWQTVSDYESRHLKPNHVLLADAIRRGEENGVKRVNLGASPPQAKGLINYKERWGGVRVNYNCYSYKSKLRRLIKR